MSNICLKKPTRITLHYDDDEAGVIVILNTPPFFDQLFFEVDDEELKELEELGVLK